MMHAAAPHSLAEHVKVSGISVSATEETGGDDACSCSTFTGRTRQSKEYVAESAWAMLPSACQWVLLRCLVSLLLFSASFLNKNR